MLARPRLFVREAAIAVALVVVASVLVAAAAPASARVVSMCFPVLDRPAPHYDTFGAPRSGGRSHAGEDIFGKKMFRIVAPVDGVILPGRDGIRFENNSAGGNSLRMLGDDGIYYVFIHLNNDTPGTDDGQATYDQAFGPGIEPGVRVHAGRVLGYMGDSGNAEETPPHLHFEILTTHPSNPKSVWASEAFDPYPSLKAARPCGDGTIGHDDIERLIPGDFDGDGMGELFAYVPGPGPDRVYAGQSDRTLRTFGTPNVNGRYQPLVGDFDGDGHDDILWYAPGPAPESVWYGTDETGEFDITPGPPANGNYVPLLGDFDGDGYGDILWYAPGPTQDYVWYGSSTPGRFTSVRTVANGFYEPFTGDFDGDGIDDIMWYGPGTAPDSMWYGTRRRGEFASFRQVANGVYKPFTGDFDGNGTDDIYWYAPGPARDHIWYAEKTKGRYQSINHNVNGTYQPVAVDLDGDGRDDVFWWKRGTALTPTWFGTSQRGRFDHLVV